MGKIREQLVVVLIDTRSTHSFVDHNLARRIRLLAENRSQVNVIIAPAWDVVWLCHLACKELGSRQICTS